MSEKRGVAVSIRGMEFRVLSEEEPEALQRIADVVGDTMSRVEAQTGTVDTLDVALLTALNLAREVVDGRALQEASRTHPERLRSLIELAESAITTEPC